jgi:hypothetical protein
MRRPSPPPSALPSPLTSRATASALWVMLSAAALCGHLCAVTPSPCAADDGKAALQLAAADASLIVSVNVERLRAAPLYHTLWISLLTSPDVSDALSQLKGGAGFEPERDLSTLLLLTPADVERSQNYLLVAQGRFDRARFLAFAQSKGASYQERVHEGVTFYEVGPLAALGFIDSFLVLGTPASLRGAADVLRGATPKLTDSPALTARIRRLDQTLDAWFVFSLPPTLRADLAAASGLPSVSEVSAFSGSLDLQAGLTLQLYVHVDTAASAEALATFINALLHALAKRPELISAGLSDALSLPKAIATKDEVSLRLYLSAADTLRALTLIQSTESPDEGP